jgi:hypothetical protein
MKDRVRVINYTICVVNMLLKPKQNTLTEVEKLH